MASATFGIDGELVPLDSERDQNLLVAGQWVVKVANLAEAEPTLALQVAALAHLAAADPTLPLPRLQRSADGEALVRWTPVGAAGTYLVRCVTYVPGRPLATVHRTASVETDLGRVLGRLSAALQGFTHAGAHRPDFLWNLDLAQQCRPWLADVADPSGRAVVERALGRHLRRVVPVLGQLRTAVVHHDANDFNVLVDGEPGAEHISGIIDFGDMLVAAQVNELAVALAYALLDVPDIVATARRMIGAYVAEFALAENELEVLFDLVVARLAMSVIISSHRSREFADNEYLLVTQAPALRLLRRLMGARPEFWHFVARDAAGLAPVPGAPAIVEWLASPASQPGPVLHAPLGADDIVTVSLADGAPGMEFAADPVAYEAWLDDYRGQRVAIGLYDEDRNVYRGDQFTTDAPETRSVHIGIDLFVPVDTPVLAMLPGRVVSVVDNDMPYDYGPTVVLEHSAGDAGPFWCLYGHLSRRTLTTVSVGQVVAAGDVVGFVGDRTVNGGWSPHTHVQVMTDLLVGDDGVFSGNFEGAGEPSRMSIWHSLVPDANLLLRLPLSR